VVHCCSAVTVCWLFVLMNDEHVDDDAQGCPFEKNFGHKLCNDMALCVFAYVRQGCPFEKNFGHKLCNDVAFHLCVFAYSMSIKGTAPTKSLPTIRKCASIWL
jgi:hypothetical protein